MMRLNVLVPSGQWALEAVFAAGCDCQAWRPAPEDEHRDSYDGQEHMTKSGGHRYMLYVWRRITPFNGRRPSPTGEMRRNAFFLNPWAANVPRLESGRKVGWERMRWDGGRHSTDGGWSVREQMLITENDFCGCGILVTRKEHAASSAVEWVSMEVSFRLQNLPEPVHFRDRLHWDKRSPAEDTMTFINKGELT